MNIDNMVMWVVDIGRLGVFLQGVRGSFLLLVIIFLSIPETVGFQYLAWDAGGNHFAFMISALTWRLEFSDWLFGIDEAVNGWLFQPNTWLIARILDDFSWTLVHVNMVSYLLALLIPISRIVFICMVALFKLERVDRKDLIVVGFIVLGISIIECVVMMTINVIYGLPPGMYISIVRPDTDTRLFVPIPILLIVGFYLSRKPCAKTVDSEVVD